MDFSQLASASLDYQKILSGKSSQCWGFYKWHHWKICTTCQPIFSVDHIYCPKSKQQVEVKPFWKKTCVELSSLHMFLFKFVSLLGCFCVISTLKANKKNAIMHLSLQRLNHALLSLQLTPWDCSRNSHPQWTSPLACVFSVWKPHANLHEILKLCCDLKNAQC